MKDLVQDGFPVVKSYIDAHDTAAKRAVEANIAPVETDAAASVGTYAIGDQLILNDVLYEATAAIDPGDALETTGAGANIQEADKIAKQIQDANGDITSLNSALSSKEDAPTILTSTLSIGATSLTFSDASITTSSILDVYADLYGIAPTDITVTTGQAVLTFDAQTVAVSVKLFVR